MSRILAVMFCLATPFAVFAQNYSVGTIYGPNISSSYYHWCGDTVYDPEVFALASGDLCMLAQGGDPNTGIDSFFEFTRDHTNGAWSLPTQWYPNLPTAVTGGYARCIYSPYGLRGPIASPSVVHVGDRYYMAYVGGNADYITGKVYWAVSYDGLSWYSYDWNAPAGEILSPIVYPPNHEECGPGSQGFLASGAGQLTLAYDSGFFYLHIRYGHWNDGQFLGVETVAFRFSYNSAHPFGIGPIKQIFQGGFWVSDSGRLVWNYDRDQYGNQYQPFNGDPILVPYNSSQLAPQSGDMKQDPGTGRWVFFYQSYPGQASYAWQSATSLDGQNWTMGGTVDTTNLTAAFGNSVAYLNPGVYMGPLCNGCLSTRVMFVPVQSPGCGLNNAYSGDQVVPVELKYQ